MSAIAKTNGSGFALQPGTLDEAMSLASMLSGSQMVPKCYQNKPQDTLVAMMMGSELGLNPIQSLQNIAVINGKPAIYGDALLALVQNNAKFGGHEESFDDSTMTAICTVWRKGDEKKHTVRFGEDDAKKASLWGKQGPWAQYPKRMLMWRARGYALRDKFADVLGGLITVEEARDTPVERDVTPAREYISAPQEPAEQPAYPQDQFDKNLPAWTQFIGDGKATPDQIIGKVQSRWEMTQEQIDTLKEITAPEAAGAAEVAEQ